MNGGRLARTYFTELNAMLSEISNDTHKANCMEFMKALQGSLAWLAKEAIKDPEQAGAAATPLLRMFALTTIAVLWAKMADTASKEDVAAKYSAEFLDSKVKCADHFYRLYKSEMSALHEEVCAGKDTLMAFAGGEF